MVQQTVALHDRLRRPAKARRPARLGAHLGAFVSRFSINCSLPVCIFENLDNASLGILGKIVVGFAAIVFVGYEGRALLAPMEALWHCLQKTGVSGLAGKGRESPARTHIGSPLWPVLSSRLEWHLGRI